MDEAHEWTDEQIKRLAERLRYHYRKAARDLAAKTKRRLLNYSENLVNMSAARAAGEISGEEFKDWCEKQAIIHARDTAMINELAEAAQQATATARGMISDQVPKVYAECANRAAYTVDKAIGRDTLFNLLNRNAALVLLQDNPWVLPLSDDLYAKGKRFHSQRLTSAITQGVLQGESVPDVAKRIRAVTAMDYRASERAARTALNCAENMGRQYTYEQAIAKGIRGYKEWNAVIDGRTRESHRELDGVRVGVHEKFPNGLIEPGDPSGEAGEVWNCRCGSSFVQDDEQPLSELERWSKLPDDVTYDDWKKGVYRTDKSGKETAASKKERGL